MHNDISNDIIETTHTELEVVETDAPLEVVELEDVPLTDVNFGF